mgnify:CR=1 FL=1
MCFYYGMIYSKKLQTYIPIHVDKVVYDNPNYRKITKYTVKDGKIPVGRVSLSDLPNGVFVEFMENLNPELYKNFGYLADQIEVEHCINRDLKDFEIISNASLNSHALHYLRGKRFILDSINQIVRSIIELTPKNQQFQTKFLGSVKMYMPKDIIQKYIEIIKRTPILKK